MLKEQKHLHCLVGLAAVLGGCNHDDTANPASRPLGKVLTVESRAADDTEEPSRLAVAAIEPVTDWLPIPRTNLEAQTSRQFDIAIEGSGFFQVTDPDGTILYTRAGNLSLNADDNLVIGSASLGFSLEPSLTIPANATNISIDTEGRVAVHLPGQTQLSPIGQLQLASFANPDGLLSVRENLYTETVASGTPRTGNPETNGMGKIRQGVLESSIVDVELEMLKLPNKRNQSGTY